MRIIRLHPFRSRGRGVSDARWLVSVFVSIVGVVGCAQIRSHRNVEQPLGPEIVTSPGSTVFRLNKVGDLPNAVGGRDIFGGKVDRGYAEVKLVAIDGATVVLDVVDTNRQSTETTMDRYKADAGVDVDVQQVVSESAISGIQPYRLEMDTTKQRELVVAGIRITFVEIQPYSIRYVLDDTQSR